MTELNEKMLKFAGFVYHNYEVYEYEHKDTRIDDPYWEDPKGQTCDALPDFPNDPTACFEWLVPLVGFDTLWIIRNPDKTSYCWGYTRGIDNDVICWSKTLPIESCLSPVEDEPATAFCKAVELLMEKA